MRDPFPGPKYLPLGPTSSIGDQILFYLSIFFLWKEGKKKGVKERKKDKEKEGERMEMLLYSKNGY